MFLAHISCSFLSFQFLRSGTDSLRETFLCFLHRFHVVVCPTSFFVLALTYRELKHARF